MSTLITACKTSGTREVSNHDFIEGSTPKIFINSEGRLNVNAPVLHPTTHITSLEPMYYFDDKAIQNLNYFQGDLKAGDTVYFLPEVSVPRFKFRELGEEVGFKTVRKTSSASHAVINIEKFIDRHTARQWGDSCDCKLFLEVFDEYPDSYIYINQAARDLLNQTTTIQFSYHVSRLLRNANNHAYNHSSNHNLRELSSIASSNDHMFVKESWIADAQVIDKVICSGIHLIKDAAINRMINPDTVISSEVYNRLNQMLASNDEANIGLAMEIMANADIEASLFFMLCLIRNHGTTMYYNSAFNHVNFKAFRETLAQTIDTSNPFRYVTIDSDWIITKMGQLGLLKMEHVNALMEDIKQSMSRANTPYFQIEKIKATPKLIEYLALSKIKEEDAVN